jgi:hypothetical protein
VIGWWITCVFHIAGKQIITGEIASDGNVEEIAE